MNDDQITIGLFDMDSLVYQVAFKAESKEDAERILIDRVNEICDRASELLGVDRIVYYQGNIGNFRKEIYPEYKANRKAERPEFYDDVVSVCRREFDSVTPVGVEVDDQIADDSLLYSLMGEKVVIIAIDKDYDQIPFVTIYNYNKDSHKETTAESAMHSFFNQMLCGDSADNIKGARGIGPKKAEKILSDVVGNKKFSYIRKTVEAYKNAFGDDWRAEIELNYKLLTLGADGRT